MTLQQYPKLSNPIKFRLNTTTEIKYYFIAEIREKEVMVNRLSKYIAVFDFFDKALIVLTTTNGVVSIASFATVIVATVGIASARFSFVFCVTGITKKN